jgi:hypothetical protein
MQGECDLAAGKRGPPWHGSMAACAYACLTGPANGEYIKDGIVHIFPVFSNNINPSIALISTHRVSLVPIQLKAPLVTSNQFPNPSNSHQ